MSNKKIIISCKNNNAYLLKAGNLYRIHGDTYTGSKQIVMYEGRYDGIMRRPLFMFYYNGKFYSRYFDYETVFEEINYNKEG